MRSASLPCCISPMSGAVSVSGRHSGARWRSQSASACRRASASSLCSTRCRRRWRCCTRRWRSSCWRSRSCMPSGSPRRARARAHQWRRFHRHRERDTMRGNGISEAPRVLEGSHAGEIAVLKMGHGKVNALDIELCGHITSRLEELGTSSAPAVVLTGQAGIFSAGVDLIRALEGGGAYLRDFLPVLRKLFDVMFFYPKPVVAAINGHAIAGGCVLACAADQRLMPREAGRIGVTELLVGVPFPSVAMEIMRCATTSRYFEEAIFGGATYAPAEAAQRGLANEIVASEELLAGAVARAKALAAISPSAFALTKRQMRQPALERVAGDTSRDEVEQIWT